MRFYSVRVFMIGSNCVLFQYLIIEKQRSLVYIKSFLMIFSLCFFFVDADLVSYHSLCNLYRKSEVRLVSCEDLHKQHHYHYNVGPGLKKLQS